MPDQTTEQRITGLRMLDVRVQIAQQGNGLKTVDKIHAGHYVITTADSRRWNVTEANGFWFGQEA